MNTQQLIEYIQNYLKEGRSEDDIRMSLQQGGWQADAIDEAFRQINQSPAPAPTTPLAPSPAPTAPTTTDTTFAAPTTAPEPATFAPNPGPTTTPIPTTPAFDTPAATMSAPMANADNESDKSFITTWLLALLFGSFGADRFYLGYTGLGIAKLLTAGGFGIWSLIDIVRISFGLQKDKQGRTLQGYEKNKKLVKILVGVLVILAMLSLIGTVLLSLFSSSEPSEDDTANTARQYDASTMASSIVTFASNHEGVSPQSVAPEGVEDTILLCGADCSDFDDTELVILTHYKSEPMQVSFHDYSSNLTVPDADTMYIVNGTTCNDTKASDDSFTGIGAESPDAMAILFALQSGSGIQQRCVAP